MTDTTHAAVWPILTYPDAHAGIRFLADALGFEERAVHTREGDPAIVEHAELRRPGGGGVMLGTAGKDGGPFGRRAPGNDAVYLVHPDPDALFARVVAAGAEVVMPLTDQPYGSRDFVIRDPQGVLWSVGTYAGT